MINNARSFLPAQDLSGAVAHPLVAQAHPAAEKGDIGDIYGGVPDTLLWQAYDRHVADVTDKGDIYGGVPDIILWKAYDAYVASMRTVRRQAPGPLILRRPRARRAARRRPPARYCPEAEAARPQLQPTRRRGRAAIPALRPLVPAATAMDAARAGTVAPVHAAALLMALGGGAVPWRALVAAQPPAHRELAAAYGAADAGSGGNAAAEAQLARAVAYFQ